MDRNAIIHRAHEVGNLLASSAGVAEELERNIDAKEYVGRGPLFLMMEVEKALGEEAMKALPVPGSTASETNNPDVYSWYETNSRGKRTERKGSFYKELYNAHFGAHAVATLEHIKNALASKPEGVPASIAKMGRVELIAEEKRLKATKNNGFNALLTAISLHFKLKEIQEQMGERLLVRIQTDKDGAIMKTATPILIMDKTDPLQSNVFSPADIARMNVKQAVEGHGEYEAGSFNALRYSRKEAESRATNKAGGKEGQNSLIVKNMTELEGLLSKIGHFLAQENSYERILKWVNTDDVAEHRSRVVLLGDLFMNGDGIWEAIRQEYRALTASKTAEMVPAGAKHA